MSRNVDYTKVLSNPLTKTEIKDPDGTVITIQHLLFDCATRHLQGDESLSSADKLKLHELSNRIVDLKPLKAEQMLKLKERGLKFLSIVAYGFVCDEIAEALGEVPAAEEKATT